MVSRAKSICATSRAGVELIFPRGPNRAPFPFAGLRCVHLAVARFAVTFYLAGPRTASGKYIEHQDHESHAWRLIR